MAFFQPVLCPPNLNRFQDSTSACLSSLKTKTTRAVVLLSAVGGALAWLALQSYLRIEVNAHFVPRLKKLKLSGSLKHCAVLY
jgi:hypothetical protein